MGTTIKMDMPKSNDFIKFRTFRVLEESGHKILSKIICAYRPTILAGDKGGLAVGIAFCSPDDAYSKKRGRLKAKGRLTQLSKTRVVNSAIGDIKKALREVVIDDANKRKIRWMSDLVFSEKETYSPSYGEYIKRRMI